MSWKPVLLAMGAFAVVAMIAKRAESNKHLLLGGAAALGVYYFLSRPK